MTEQNDFKIKELCWAKIKGYPWWPAIIRDIYNAGNNKLFFVGYFCERNGSILNESNLKKWEKNYNEFKEGISGKIKTGKSSTIQNDFLCALKVGDMYYKGKIDVDDHENFLNQYTNTKDRHSFKNIDNFFNKVINKNNNKEKLKESNNKNENKSEKKLIGKKRNIPKKMEKENEKERGKEKEKEKENKTIIKDNEINMKQKELDKMDDLINNITYNMDEILLKSEQYQKFFIKECKEKNISINDNKNLKTKIELIKYLQILSEALNVPMTLNSIIQNMNIK